MPFWILFAVLIAVPLIVQLRGGGIVAMSISVSMVIWFGLGMLTALALLPNDLLMSLLGASAPVEDTPSASVLDALILFYVVSIPVAIVPSAVFAVIALVFWALDRWQASFSQRVLKPLFWVAYVGLLCGAVAIFYVTSNGMPDTLADLEAARCRDAHHRLS